MRARAFIRSGEEVIGFLKIRKNRTDEGEWPCLCSLIVFLSLRCLCVLVPVCIAREPRASSAEYVCLCPLPYSSPLQLCIMAYI